MVCIVMIASVRDIQIERNVVSDPFFIPIFLSPRLSFTYSTFHQQVVSVYVGTGGHTAISKAAEKYGVTILPDCCTTVSEILHLVALHTVSTRVKLVPSSEVL